VIVVTSDIDGTYRASAVPARGPTQAFRPCNIRREHRRHEFGRWQEGLVVGIADEHSIAFGCAEVIRKAGAELAVTYLNARAKPDLRPLAERLESPIIVPCDVREPDQFEAAFARIKEKWGRLDFLLHSIAYAPREDLHSRITDCSQAGFALAMDVSCHSFIRTGAFGGTSDDGAADAC